MATPRLFNAYFDVNWRSERNAAFIILLQGAVLKKNIILLTE